MLRSNLLSSSSSLDSSNSSSNSILDPFANANDKYQHGYIQRLTAKGEPISQASCAREINLILSEIFCNGKEVLTLDEAKQKYPDTNRNWQKKKRNWVTPEEAAENVVPDNQLLSDILRSNRHGLAPFFGPDGRDLPRALKHTVNVIRDSHHLKMEVLLLSLVQRN